MPIVSRSRDPQFQVSKKDTDLTKWRSTILKSCRLISHFIFNVFKSSYLISTDRSTLRSLRDVVYSASIECANKK